MPKPTLVKESSQKGLRTGFSTGACSAAAARAAMLGLVTGEIPLQIESLLPNGMRVIFDVTDGRVEKNIAHAVIIKDAGDDPDATDKAHLTCDITLTDQIGQIELQGGVGIGTVTLPGLGLEVGTSAINPVPRKNIIENLQEVGSQLLEKQGLKVVISVPDGEQRAKRTLNARLGILGGISILGTTGIVKAFSTAAFKACVIQGVEVAAEQKKDIVVLTTGGRTEKFVMKELPEVPQACFVQMGDFFAAAMDAVIKEGITSVVVGAMVGKLAKIVQGEKNTHARKSPVNMALLAEIAEDLGAGEAVCTEIKEAQTARFAAEKLAELGLAVAFHQVLAKKCIARFAEEYPAVKTVRVLVCDFEGNKLVEESSEERL